MVKNLEFSPKGVEKMLDQQYAAPFLQSEGVDELLREHPMEITHDMAICSCWDISKENAQIVQGERRCGMNDFDIPIRPSVPGKYTLTEEDKEYLKSFAVDGVIPLDDCIRAVNKILNK